MSVDTDRSLGPLSRFALLRSGTFIDHTRVLQSGQYPVYGANGRIGWTDEFNYSGVEVVVGRVGSCGAISVVEGPAWVTDNTIVVTPVEGVDARYLAYALAAKHLRLLASSSIQPLLTQKTLASVEILVPPLTEQQHIVTKLDEQVATLDRAEKALTEQQAAALAFRRAALQTALDPITHPRWPVVTLKEVVAEAQSGFASGDRDEHGVLQLRMNNVTSYGRLDWSQTLRVPATEAIIDRYSLVPGDVMFNNTNSTELVGKSALFCGYRESVVFSNHFTRMRVKRSLLDARFLADWLLHMWNRHVFQDICNRWIGQSAVKSERLLALSIPLPSLREQVEVVGRLEAAMEHNDVLLDLLDRQAATLHALRTSLLDAAFNGKA